MKALARTLAFALILSTAAVSFAAGKITVKGSDTMVILAQKWAEVYMTKNPGVEIQVTGGGTGTGFAALQNQTTDLCNASRPIKAKEKETCIKAFGKLPREYQVCMDGLAVYVHESSPIKELTLQQVQDLFTGKLKNWNEVGGPDAPVTLYSRENSSGTYEFFKEHGLGGKDFAASAQTMPGTAAVLQSVSKDKAGIGYGGIAYGAGAKPLKIKKDAASPAIEPTLETVQNESYPIWRYLFIYVNPALDKGDVAAYLKWMRTPEGQKVVNDVGYFPLPAKLLAK